MRWLRDGLQKVSRLKAILSTTSLAAIVVAFVGMTLAGGIYDLLEHPASFLSTSTGISVIVNGNLGQQTLTESLIAGLLYFLGLAGFYMLLRSMRFAYRPRNAYLLLILGTITTLTVVLYSNALIIAKIDG